jgi:hypothetical protein
MTLLAGVNSKNHKINHKLMLYRYFKILLYRKSEWCQMMAYFAAQEWSIRSILIWTHQIKCMKYNNKKKNVFKFYRGGTESLFLPIFAFAKKESGEMKKENNVEG